MHIIICVFCHITIGRNLFLLPGHEEKHLRPWISFTLYVRILGVTWSIPGSWNHELHLAFSHTNYYLSKIVFHCHWLWALSNFVKCSPMFWKAWESPFTMCWVLITFNWWLLHRQQNICPSFISAEPFKYERNVAQSLRLQSFVV